MEEVRVGVARLPVEGIELQRSGKAGAVIFQLLCTRPSRFGGGKEREVAAEQLR